MDLKRLVSVKRGLDGGSFVSTCYARDNETIRYD